MRELFTRYGAGGWRIDVAGEAAREPRFGGAWGRLISANLLCFGERHLNSRQFPNSRAEGTGVWTFVEIRSENLPQRG
jgi:hypothetical protein